MKNPLSILRRPFGVLLVFFGVLCAGPTWADVGRRIAVIDFELQDDMKQGGHAPGHEDVLRRTAMLTDIVREAVEQGERYELIDLAGHAEAYEALRGSQAYVYRCEPCFLDFAREIGADYVMTGWVQRVSNLIINFNLKIYDVETGQLADGGSIDIRGNTDKTWQDGADYVIRRLRVGL